MEARGVEPLSKTTSTKDSPGAALVLKFPSSVTQRQVTKSGSL